MSFASQKTPVTFRLHGVSVSTCTRRAALIARERNIPYELVPVNFKVREHKQAPHLEHQPFGQVPYITQDDGFELFESRAIGRYLATLGSGPGLVPTEPKAYAKFEQAASIEYAQFDPLASAIGKEAVIKPYYGQPTDEARLKELEVTLADLYHLPYGSMVFESGYGDLENRPNLHRWWKDISERPAWQAVKDGA
ncbi:thioredoxin-like protein [Gloeopeniophorella convolvens]|nr:thioredoxin-like protein [Gloeopeniophorella convolvens]